MSVTRNDILLSLQQALLGEIYPSIRMVVFDYNQSLRKFTLRYYLDRESNKDDFESISCVVGEFLSHFKYTEFEEIKEECIYSLALPSEIDILDGMVYLRKE